MHSRGRLCHKVLVGAGRVEQNGSFAVGEAESKASTKYGMRVDGQRQIALILKGSSLVAEATGRQQVSRTGRRKLTGRESKTSRSGGVRD
jgi:hypothetical protein